MSEDLTRAVRLRKEGRAEEARAILLELAAERPDDPQVQYQCAWVHDSLGREREAVPFYERAIAGGLSGRDLEGAFVGLGSTYRSLGEYRRAVETLREGCPALGRVLRVCATGERYRWIFCSQIQVAHSGSSVER